NPELNTTAIGNLIYIPSVSGAEKAVHSAAVEMKIAGMLAPTTNVDDLARRAFVHLDGVSDEWLKTVEVPKLADGQIPPDQEMRLAAEIALTNGVFTADTCCSAGKKPAKPAQ